MNIWLVNVKKSILKKGIKKYESKSKIINGLKKLISIMFCENFV